MPDHSRAQIIDARSLAAAYGSKPIWQNANFDIKAGEFVGILGPNGAGKTTLFRSILGLTKPAAGSLSVFGRAPSKGDPRIGYVPQRRVLNENSRLEAIEIVRLGLNGTRWGFSLPATVRAEQRLALKALKQTDSQDLAHRPVGELSGGELQRVFLAQALIGKPELLLLDEPLANLDIKRGGQFMSLLRQIVSQNGITVLLITHDINPLLPVANRIIYIANGKLTIGRPEEIISTETLSKLYDAPVEVLRDSRGRLAVVGIEEAAHHDE